jgi:hypothetical protein
MLHLCSSTGNRGLNERPKVMSPTTALGKAQRLVNASLQFDRKLQKRPGKGVNFRYTSRGMSFRGSIVLLRKKDLDACPRQHAAAIRYVCWLAAKPV